MLVLAKNQSELYSMATPRAQPQAGGGGGGVRGALSPGSRGGGGRGGASRGGDGAGVGLKPKERHKLSVTLAPTAAPAAGVPAPSTSAQGVKSIAADDPMAC